MSKLDELEKKALFAAHIAALKEERDRAARAIREAFDKGPVELTNPRTEDRLAYLLSRDPHEPSRFRITYFETIGPTGHLTGSLEEMIKEAAGGMCRKVSPGAIDRLMSAP